MLNKLQYRSATSAGPAGLTENGPCVHALTDVAINCQVLRTWSLGLVLRYLRDLLIEL
mgnify:CR=1 FL=1